MSRKFLTVIESGKDCFGAFAPDIQGCVACSSSVERTKALFKVAAEAHMRELTKAGESIPEPRTLEIPGLTIGTQSGAITLEWTSIEFQEVEKEF